LLLSNHWIQESKDAKIVLLWYEFLEKFKRSANIGHVSWALVNILNLVFLKKYYKLSKNNFLRELKLARINLRLNWLSQNIKGLQIAVLEERADKLSFSSLWKLAKIQEKN